MMDTDENGGSWKARCDRYFTSLTDSGANGDDDSTENDTVPKGDKSGGKGTWKSLSELKKHTKFRRNYLKRLFSVVDIHGARICGSTNNVYEFIIWLFIILASVSALAYLVYLQVDKYNSPSSKFETLDIGTFVNRDTPLVSFCSRNKIKKSKVIGSRFADLANIDLDNVVSSNNNDSIKPDTIKNIIDSNKKLVKLLSESGDDIKETILSELEDNIISRGLLQSSNMSVLTYLVINGWTDLIFNYLAPTFSEIEGLGHKMNDMLVRCFLDGRECKDSELVEVANINFGNCFTITASEKTRPGTLDVILDLQSGEYIDIVSPSVGVNVIIHHDAITPTSTFLDGSAHKAASNTHVDVDILKETLLSRIENGCSPGQEYDKKACLESCKNDAKEDICGCQSSTTGQNNASGTCRNDVLTEYLCVRAIDEIQKLERLNCQCPERCSQISYTTKSSVLSWPSEQNIKYLQSHMKQQKRNDDPVYIRNNLVKVSVSLRPQVYHEVKETENVKLLDVLAMVGGLSALLAGVSVLTLVELIWLATKTIYHFVLLRCTKNDVKNVQRLSDSEITSITWAMHRLKRREEEAQKERETKNQKKHQNVLTGNVQRQIAKRNNYFAPVIEDQEPIYAKVKDTPYEKLNIKRHPDKDQEMLRGQIRMPDNVAHRHAPGNFEVSHYDYAEPTHPRLMRISRKMPENSEPSRNNIMHLEGIYRPANHQIYYERVTYPQMGRIVTPADAIQLYGGQYFNPNQISDPVYI